MSEEVPEPLSPIPAAQISDARPRPVPPPQGLAPGTLADWLNWGERELIEASDSPRADVEVLLAALLAVPRSSLAARRTDPVEAATVLRLASWIERRRLGEPVAYITGLQGFWSIDLVVDSAVLIPRADTETLVEWALELARARLREPNASSPLTIADLGTGSGAIALALADELPETGVSIMATDASEAALAVARENAQRLGFLERVHFVQGHWFEPMKHGGSDAQRFDLIVSNPPYIAEGDAHLAALHFEPRLALSCGPDGLDAIREIVQAAPDHLQANAWLLLEHGHDQGAAVRELMIRRGFADVSTRRDFGGNERTTGGCWRGQAA